MRSGRSAPSSVYFPSQDGLPAKGQPATPARTPRHLRHPRRPRFARMECGHRAPPRRRASSRPSVNSASITAALDGRCYLGPLQLPRAASAARTPRVGDGACFASLRIGDILRETRRLRRRRLRRRRPRPCTSIGACPTARPRARRAPAPTGGPVRPGGAHCCGGDSSGTRRRGRGSVGAAGARRGGGRRSTARKGRGGRRAAP